MSLARHATVFAPSEIGSGKSPVFRHLHIVVRLTFNSAQISLSRSNSILASNFMRQQNVAIDVGTNLDSKGRGDLTS